MKWISRIFFLLALLVTALFFIEHGQYKNIYHADSLGYYSYLPSYFNLQNFDSISRFPKDGSVPEGVISHFEQYTALRQKSDIGYYISPYTYGVSFFETPFYGVAELYFKLTNQKSTGYSQLHHTMLIVSNFFYVFLGLFFLFKILRRFFETDVSLLTISFVLLASNLFWFTTIQFGMSHPILFCLVGWLIYCTIRFYEKPSTGQGVIIFLTLGFITIIRPTDILFGLIPLFYGIGNWQSIKERFVFFKKHSKKILISIPFFFIPFIPQLLYWKKYTGSYLFYAYANEGFNFLEPKLLEGLFGPDNGWLLYTPLWIISILLLFTKRKLHGFRVLIFVMLSVYLYVIYSWDCYQYINGFGARPMLHLYGLLAIPLATAIQWASQRKWVMISMLVLFSFFSYHNIHFSYLTQSGKYWSAFSNYAFYWNMMFKNNLSYNDIVVKDTRLVQPDALSLKQLAHLSTWSPSQDTIYEHQFDEDLQDSVLVIPKGIESPQISLKASIDKFLNKKDCYIKASCIVKFMDYNFDPYQSTAFIHKFGKEDGTEISWTGLDLYTKMGLPNNRDLAVDSIWLYGGQPYIWDTISFYIPLMDHPELMTSKVDFWNMARKTFYLNKVKLEVYQKK